MPLLSVIIPVYAVQGYLRECLDSILTQSHADVELIAIDDRSPDHCAAILDEYAARDARVQVIHLDQNVGLGPARNVGLDRATGAYVWFVDSDDWLAPGALRAVAAKLRACTPDLLLLDHTRVDWLGREWPSAGREFLRRRDTGECFQLTDDASPLALFTVAWNKVVRREFLRRSGVRFDVGWYEDLPFSYPILVAADRIATLGRVCYHYRKRRQDAITGTRSARHFEVFDQYERVFARLDEQGERARPFRREIFRRMLWHYLVIQSQPDRVPPQLHREFFHRIAEHYRRFRPADDSTAGLRWLDRVRRRLIAADAYRTFRALRLVRLASTGLVHTARRGLRFARRALGWARFWARRAIGAAYYAGQRRLPVDDRLAVYAAYWYRGYACNPAAIHAAATRLVPSVQGVWIVDRREAETMPPGVSYVVAGSLSSYRALARARWLINNVNFPDFVVKRPGTVHLQTHHGTPVKVMGLDQGAFPVGLGSMDLGDLLRRCDRWDLSLSANAHSTEVWAREYPCRYETLEYGYPRNDRLARADNSDVDAARATLEIPPHATVVLYAPTYREYDPRLGPPLDVEELAEELGPGYLVLQRVHYFHSGAAEPYHPRVRDITAYPCVEDLLLATDVLVTDYSSVMFDFAVLDRPIALFTPDWDTYRRTRGVTFDLLAEPPGVVAMTPADLVDAFRSREIWGDPAAKARAQFRNRFCYLDDGHAAERVVRRLFRPEPA
ncbi:MAG: CDP-glycerol glycerophosphotransferase family protein [Micromonosporaceae bacterium]